MIEEPIKKLAQGNNFAAFTTMLASGMPMTHVMWVDADDEHILINTEVHRQKYKNIQNDPRVAVAIIDLRNPYHYAEVRGRVVAEITGPAARDHIDRLSEKYIGVPYEGTIKSERVILRIQPDRQRMWG
jgi:PPOX class probable F420-dependent enzyme